MLMQQTQLAKESAADRGSNKRRELTTEGGLETRARKSPEVCVSPHALVPGAHPLAIEGSLLALPMGIVGRILAAVASLANSK
jgi:hypothetical protein